MQFTPFPPLPSVNRMLQMGGHPSFAGARANGEVAPSRGRSFCRQEPAGGIRPKPDLLVLASGPLGLPRSGHSHDAHQQLTPIGLAAPSPP